MTDIHIGDIGTSFRVTVVDQNAAVVDISSATTKQLLFKLPNGTVLTKTASFVTDGTDGKMEYVTAEDDLSAKGNWSLQGYVVLSGGEWHTDIAEFKVHRNLS